MNYDDLKKIRKFDNLNEPSNEELKEIEEHLDDYTDE